MRATLATLSCALLLAATSQAGAEVRLPSFLDNLLDSLGPEERGPEYDSGSVLGDGDYSDLGLMDQYPDQDLDTMDAIYSPQQQQPPHQAAQPQAQKPKEQAQGKSRMKGGVLPAYCDPPNPCPAGYTAEDGCIQMEEFENKAEFSRKYQASQNCMCDSEHMFSCPDINSFDPVYKERQDADMFGLPGLEEINNPYLSGSKLPIAAKKGMGY